MIKVGHFFSFLQSKGLGLIFELVMGYEKNLRESSVKSCQFQHDFT